MNAPIGISLQLLQDWFRLLTGDTDKFIAARKVAEGITALLLGQDMPASPPKVIDVPALPVSPYMDGVYRIQIEDGAWVGTLDEWRALIALANKRQPVAIGEPAVDYLVIRTSDEDSLLSRVATAIREGWVCQGGVSITSCTRTGNVIAAQAMVRK